MAEGGGHDWGRENYPIAWLPLPARLDIANYLDGSSGAQGFEMFAYYLGFNPVDTRALRVRSRSADFHYSATIALLVQLETTRSGPSIQDLYRILVRMQSAAVDVIISYLPQILRITREGQQNTEPSFCVTCDVRTQSQNSEGYPRRPDRPGNESDEHTLYTANSTRNTRSLRTFNVQDGHSVPHHPESQPSIEPRSSRSRLVGHDLEQATTNGAVSCPIPGTQQGGTFRRQHSVNQSSPETNIRYGGTRSDQLQQWHNSVGENSIPWISPDFSICSGPGLRPHSDSEQPKHLRSFSEPANSLGSHSENSCDSVIQVAPSLSRARNDNGRERADFNPTCQECRLAIDCEETVVFTPYLEPKNSCALHSESHNSPVMPHNKSFPGFRTQNGHESATFDENFNDPLRVNRLNPDLKSVSVQGNQYGESVNEPGSFSSQKKHGYSYNHKQDGDEETVPKTMDSLPKNEGLTNQSNRQMASVHSDKDETALKTSCINDVRNKFESLTLGCPMCDNTQRKELIRSLNPQAGQATCSCSSRYGHGTSFNRNMASVNPTEDCPLCQAEASSCVTGQSMQELKSTSKTEGKSSCSVRRKSDERHSWHEGQERKSSVSLASSLSDSSIGSWGSSQSSDSGTKPVVLVSYSIGEDCVKNEKHMKEVWDLSEKMKESEIRVRVDMDKDSFIRKGWNRLDWLDKNLRKARFIVVCISPEYALDIKPKDGAVAQESQLNTRYMYDYIRKEFYNNQSRNTRVIPILFPNSGAQYCHVPQCLSATSVYTYSNDLDNIIRLIKR